MSSNLRGNLTIAVAFAALATTLMAESTRVDVLPIVRRLPDILEFKLSSKQRVGKGEKRRNKANRWR